MTRKRSRMNRKLMRAVADKLDSLRGKRSKLWDQSWCVTKTKCGAAHCIAGWAIMIDGKYAKKLERWESGFPYLYFNPFGAARRLLGITYHEAVQLFRGSFMWRKTPQQVAARLREFARKGRVGL